MKKYFIRHLLADLNSLATTKSPVPIERFFEVIGRDITKRLLVEPGEKKAGIRKAEKPGHVFYNGIDQEMMEARLNQMNFSF